MDIASKIPAEILGEIFLHSIDGPISSTQGNNFPWAIERVCRSWRSAFVTYPDLWTWITVNLAESYSRGQDLNAVNKRLSLCLQRSRNHPLNISLNLPTEEYDEKHPSFVLILETFLSCSHRWKFIYLANVLESQFVTLNSCTGATPILKSLTIHSCKGLLNYDDFTAFKIAPLLTRFTLLHPTAMVAVRKWSIPWMQLTNLIIRFEEINSINELSILLGQLRDIEELRLILEGEEPGVELADFDPNVKTPQCLQHLNLLDVGCLEVFDLITAPSLYELYLEGSELFYPQIGDGDPNDDLAEDIFSSFLQRSSCKIHKLTLSDFSEHPFEPLATLFPYVVELCLSEATTCLGHLLSPTHFPRLRVLDCTIHPADVSGFMRTLVAILELRNSSSIESVVPLAEVIFRPVLEDGEVSLSIPVTISDWVSFESHVNVGLCCALSLVGQLWLPNGSQTVPLATNSVPFPNTDTAPSSSSSSMLDPPSDPGLVVSTQELELPLFPPDFMQHLAISLDSFESNIFRNDGDIDFERDFGQWFNADDVP